MSVRANIAKIKKIKKNNTILKYKQTVLKMSFVCLPFCLLDLIIGMAEAIFMGLLQNQTLFVKHDSFQTFVYMSAQLFLERLK